MQRIDIKFESPQTYVNEKRKTSMTIYIGNYRFVGKADRKIKKIAVIW